jgi:hypothetical protein
VPNTTGTTCFDHKFILFSYYYLYVAVSKYAARLSIS